MAETRNVFLTGAGILAYTIGGLLIVVVMTSMRAMWLNPPSSWASTASEHTHVWPGIEEVQSIFEEIAREHMPAVVQLQLIQRDERPFGPDRLEDFFLPESFRLNAGKRTDEQSIGTGIVLREDGYIVTARHLMKNTNEVHAILHDGARLKASLVGSDALTDIAVLKIDASGLPVLPLNPEATIRSGHWVLSIGSPLSPAFQNSMTLGIISAHTPQGDSLNGSLYTDAAVNPGNSGGPLINARGQVVGMVATPYSAIRGFSGIGRAIPVEVVARVTRSIIAQGRTGRGQLGVQYGPVTANITGPDGAARIVRVEPGSAAEAAGIEENDVILAVDGMKLDSHLQLSEFVAAGQPGDVVTLTIQRGNEAIDLEVLLQNESVNPYIDSEDEDPQEKLMREMGFTVDDITPELVRDMEIPIDKGALVLYVNPASKAYREGDLRGGMVIVEMADQEIRNRQDFMRVYNAIPAGVTFLIMVHRPLIHGALLTALTKP